MPRFSYQAQLADLGVSMACNYTSMAMTGALAFATMAFALPLALAASARPLTPPIAGDAANDSPAPGDSSDPYSAYRSDGGHATTLVIVGTMPAA